MHKIETTMDQIRNKFGKNAITYGATMGKEIFGSHDFDGEAEIK
ncbi:MAG: hypothetical protein ACOX1Q_04665 [Eubacteriales bacterium]